MSRILTGLCLLTAACCAQTELTVTLMPGTWEPRPGYLGNPTQTSEMLPADGLTTLRVAEPGKGMKFELPLRPVDSGVAQYLLFRYRAASLGPGYAIWAMDGSQSGRQILATTDLALDDQWHTAAVDLTAAGVTGAIRGLLTDVQCKDAPAAITWDFQGLTNVLPDGTTVFPKQRPAPTAPDAVLRPALVGQPKPQPPWLDRDAETFSAAAEDGLVHLQAEGQNRGMKWSLSLPEPIDLTPFRFTAVRYRAQNVQADGDYAIWLGGGTDNTYCDDAHQFLRRAFAILNENEDAFCSADVEPLVPTLIPTVYANRFTGKQHTVWTLFNAEYRTFKGPCLRVPHTEETRYIDAFTEKPVPAELKDGLATIACELAPRGVGAVIATRP
ncbi:MAG: hypothetical protein A3K19_08555 [Lentisphaerae bacterium RIFOXYB12_FULL_65_16]|nr:MAG: hypothetical protein A3K18_27585 [Lentisphaerae bacterium RIFOXYA12_64_32]OGV87659.1 MAG: hypothetical protein A3K19_08555 [Lentisphaerae bacterium RIFOXYB12_FULL_65_16]